MKYDFGKRDEPFNRFCECIEDWKEIKNLKGRKYELSSKGRLWNGKRFIGDINKKYKYINTAGFIENRMNRLVYYYFVDKNIKGFEIDHYCEKYKFNQRDHNCYKCGLRKTTCKENINNPNTILKMRKPKSEEHKKNIRNGKFKGGTINKTKNNTFRFRIPINGNRFCKNYKTKDDLFIGKIYYNQLKLNVENNMVLI